MFVGLVQDPGWHRPDDNEEPSRRRPWRVPRGVVIWTLVLIGMRALIPFAEHEIGDFAGYVLVVATLTVAVWRVDRWCSRQYWRGLRDYQS